MPNCSTLNWSYIYGQWGHKLHNKRVSRITNLVKYLYGEYGERWDKVVRLKHAHGHIASTTVPKKARVAGDMHGIFPLLGKMLTLDKTTYNIYDAPRDGSCMYHAIEAIMRPSFQISTPSVDALRDAVVRFYSTTGGQLKRILEDSYGIIYADRLRDVQSPDNWGQYKDLVALATIFSIKFKLITVNNIYQVRSRCVQQFHGLRKDGRRLAKPTELQR